MLLTSSRTRRALAVLVAATLGLGATACAKGGSSSSAAGPSSTVGTSTVGATTTVPPAAAPSPTTTAGTTTTTEALPLAAPEGDAFYTPPDPLPPGRPGDVIWAREEPDAPAGARKWLVLYRSEDAAGAPIAVSGVVYAPKGDGTDRPILAWAHGTTGLGDQCAPSRNGRGGDGMLAPPYLAKGYVVTATDYQGLGTPGVHPYLVGQSEGRGVLDSIRAAQRLAGTGASAASKAVVWGHSQGGEAAASAADLAPTYAPDANVVGAAAGAPAAEQKTVLDFAAASPFFGFALMIAAGFHQAYPSLPLDPIFTAEGKKAVEEAGRSCGEIVGTYAPLDRTRFIKEPPSQAPGWAAVLEQNQPGMVRTSVPVFLYHGESDELVPSLVSKLLLERYCRVGTVAYRKTYPGGTHSGVIPLALADIDAYLTARIAGDPPPSSC